MDQNETNFKILHNTAT